MTHPEFTLRDLVLNAVQRDGGQPAIVEGGRSVTYEVLWRESSGLARALREQGLKRGDRVGIYMEKCLEAVVAMLAIAEAGGAFVNINPLLKEPQVRHIMADCGISMLFADSRKVQDQDLPPVDVLWLRGEPAPESRATGPGFRVDPLSSSPPQTGERATLAPSPADGGRMGWGSGTHDPEPVTLGEGLGGTWAARRIPLAMVGGGEDGCGASPTMEMDLATIIYTSGSTGSPKGIMLSHRNLVAGAQIVSTYLGNSAADRVLSVLPFSFDYGLNQLTTMLRAGGALVLQRSLLPGDILGALRKERVTGLAGVPSVWTLLLQNRRSLERQPLEFLRYITNSGGAIPRARLDELRALLPGTRIYLMYGLTEAFRSTYLPPEEVHRGPACIGRAIPNTDVWVVDDQGRECAVGQVGELVHRGPTVALGYWGAPDRTRAVYRPNPFAPEALRDVDTVVYSGDLVRRDADGFLYYCGRRQEFIKTEGYRISPEEIEELLYALPEVQEAVALGQEDEAVGQRVVAVVALKPGCTASPEQLRRGCQERAPHYLVPRTIHIIDAIPKTPSGKMDRPALKEAYGKPTS